MVIRHSFDADTGGVLPIREILTFIMDLKRESILGDDEKIAESEPFFITSALVHLTSTVIFPKVESLEAGTLCALKVMGVNACIPEFIPMVTSHMKHLQNIYLLELNDIVHREEDLSSTYQEFTRVLYQSPRLVSVELNNIDPKLTQSLLQNLPLSVRRLSMGTVPNHAPQGTYNLPPEVYLVCLQLQNCLSKVGDLFRNTEFPNLKKLFIKNDCHQWEGTEPLTWSKEDAQSLLDAMRTGRMSALEELNVRGCCLKECSPELIEILKSKSIRSAQLVKAELRIEDGPLFLKNIQDGNLDHMEFLSLLYNDEIGFLTKDFETASDQHDITLEMDPLLSSLPVETVQTISTFIINFFQNQSRPGPQPECQAPEDTGNEAASPLTTLVYSFIKEHVGKDAADVAARIVPSLNPGQTLNMMVFVSILTPEQRGLIKTIISSLTSEQNQAMKTLISSSALQQNQVMQTLISSFTPEQNQPIKTLISSFSPEQVQNMMTVFSLDLTTVGDLVSTVFNTDNSAGPEPAVQNMATFVSSFFENRSGCRVELETLPQEGPQSQFDFSHIRNLASMFVNPANQPKPQETSEDSQQNRSGCRVELESLSNEATQPQFDFSHIKNLVSTFMNPAKQPKPKEADEDSEQSYRGQELEDNLDLD